MKVAVTNHAVQRYQERVEGAQHFDAESVRKLIRGLVKDGFRDGLVRPHPQDKDKRIIPFSSGKSVLYLSLGPNKTDFEADLAVATVHFERELTGGRQGLGVTLGDLAPVLARLEVGNKVPRFHIVVGSGDATERYDVGGERELAKLLEKHRPSADNIHIFQRLGDEEKAELLRKHAHEDPSVQEEAPVCDLGDSSPKKDE